MQKNRVHWTKILMLLPFVPKTVWAPKYLLFQDVFSWYRKSCKKDFQKISEWYLKGECHNCGIWRIDRRKAWWGEREYFVNLHNRGIQRGGLMCRHIEAISNHLIVSLCLAVRNPSTKYWTILKPYTIYQIKSSDCKPSTQN